MKWIKCSDEMPKWMYPVLFWEPTKETMVIAYRDDFPFLNPEPTHWMPLPEPSKENDD